MSRAILQVTIRGRVQGIGYRAWLEQQARASKLEGWVRNRRDGSVEAWVQGDDAAVERVLDWARRGPGPARVDRLDVDEVEADTTLAGFRRVPNA